MQFQQQGAETTIATYPNMWLRQSESKFYERSANDNTMCQQHLKLDLCQADAKVVISYGILLTVDYGVLALACVFKRTQWRTTVSYDF